MRRASVTDTMCVQSAGLCGDWRASSAPGACRSVAVCAEPAAEITLSIARNILMALVGESSFIKRDNSRCSDARTNRQQQTFLT